MKTASTRQITPVQFGFLAFVALLLIAYLLTRAVGLDEHDERLHALLGLQNHQSVLDRSAMQVAAFSLSHYDGLVLLAREIRAAQDRLEQRFSIVIREDPEQQALLTAYLAGIERKLEVLERLKSRVSFVRNGLHYMPAIVGDITEVDPAFGSRISELLNGILIYRHLPSSQLDYDQLTAELERLAEAAAGSKAADLVANGVHHFTIYLRGMKQVAELRSAFVDIDTAGHYDRLIDAYTTYHHDQSRREAAFSLFLLLAVVLLLTGLGFALRQTQRARAQTERAWKQLYAAVGSLADAFALFDTEGRLLLHNERFVHFYPWLTDNLVDGVTTRDDIAAAAEKAGAFAEDGRSEIAEALPPPDAKGRIERHYVERLADGHWYLASDSGTADGGMACVRSDITESKRQEHELRKLTRALEQSPASVLITDTKGNIEYVNPKFAEATGYRSDEVIGQNPRILKSGDKTSDEYAELWQTITSGQEWRGQFHNKRKDGTIYWESATISPVRDGNGEITHFIAVKEDITARKRAEEQLRLNATVFDSINEGIMVTDTNNRITTVNPAFTAITGYEPEEVIGKDPKLLRSGRHDAAFYRKMWETLQKHDSWRGEIWNRRKDGSLFPEWISIAAQRDNKGEISEYIGVFSDITRRKQDEEQIRYQASFDALTGLPNRYLLLDRLQVMVRTARRRGRMVGLLFIDLDGFKTINDTMGHLAGDEMLQEVGKRLPGCLRDSDVVARFGGDEFAVILQDIEEVEQVAEIAEQVLAILGGAFELRGRDVYIGASIGICMFPNDTEDAATMLRNADMAMYKAKEDGRNRYHFYTEEMHQHVQARMELERDLRRALERDELHLVYQPIIRLSDHRLVEVEALLRWQHPELGAVSPNDFIPLAEQSGMIGPIGDWVLQNALQQLARWRGMGLGDLKVAINISSRQWHLGLTPSSLQQQLAAHDLSPASVILEITERSIIDNTAAALDWLQEARRIGLSLAIDDFGTGYSSLSYLKRFPMTMLKVDREFIRDLPGDSGDLSLVRAIVAMAQSLQLEVVAEGVETQEQADLLARIGCDYAQGYLFSKPVSASEITQLLHSEAHRANRSRVLA